MLSDEHLTPLDILSPLGYFDLDPCSPVNRPWKTAGTHYTVADDGLTQLWKGRVWLNPPFGKEAGKWMRRMAEHNDGIALLAARTETKMFFAHVWPIATAICFLRGRPHFRFVDGSRAPYNSGAPICLIAYGGNNASYLQSSGLGQTLTIRRA